MAREGRDLILQMGKGGERGVEWPRRGVLRQWEGGSLIHPTLARSLAHFAAAHQSLRSP